MRGCGGGPAGGLCSPRLPPRHADHHRLHQHPAPLLQVTHGRAGGGALSPRTWGLAPAGVGVNPGFSAGAQVQIYELEEHKIETWRGEGGLPPAAFPPTTPRPAWGTPNPVALRPAGPLPPLSTSSPPRSLPAGLLQAAGLHLPQRQVPPCGGEGAELVAAPGASPLPHPPPPPAPAASSTPSPR